MSLKVYIYELDHIISRLCLWYLADHFEIVNLPGKADVAFAPRLSPIISTSQKPTYGTLIFHPSLLPRHQGPDAVKWAFLYGEKFTGACWFHRKEEKER